MFGQGQCVLDVYTKVTHGTFNFVVAEQNLHGAQVSSLFVNDGRFCSTQRMRAVFLMSQADARHPLAHEPSILTGADVPGVVAPARKDEKSSNVPPRRSSQAKMLVRALSSNSN